IAPQIPNLVHQSSLRKDLGDERTPIRLKKRGRAQTRPLGQSVPEQPAEPAAGLPRRGYALPNGTATNLVESPDFRRINTECSPSLCKLASSWRTSSGFDTVLPAISRMTSPDLMPCSAAGPLGSTAVTATPWPPAPPTSLAGASVSPRL